MRELWIVDCRNPDGTLDFTNPQPESFFGTRAITGMGDDEMAKAIFGRLPDVTLTGDSILAWPRAIDARWSARRKTWR